MCCTFTICLVPLVSAIEYWCSMSGRIRAVAKAPWESVNLAVDHDCDVDDPQPSISPRCPTPPTRARDSSYAFENSDSDDDLPVFVSEPKSLKPLKPRPDADKLTSVNLGTVDIDNSMRTSSSSGTLQNLTRAVNALGETIACLSETLRTICPRLQTVVQPQNAVHHETPAQVLTVTGDEAKDAKEYVTIYPLSP